MIVFGISMSNFMGHAEASFSLPSTGLVVVTGPNGSGKSSLIEAVSYALGRRTLRGTDPWHEGAAGSVQVRSSVGVLETHRTAKGALSTTFEQEAGVRYATASKARAAAEAACGSWQVWRRICAFSSADADHFSSADDVDRKTLLEEVLHLDVFDAAYERADARRRAAVTDAAACRRAVEQAEVQAQLAAARLSTFDATPREQAPVFASVGLDPAAAASAAAEADEVVRAAQVAQAAEAEAESAHSAEMQQVLSALMASSGALQSHEVTLQHLRAHLEKATSASCPTCERPWEVDEAKLREAQAQIVALEAEMAAARSAHATLQERYALLLQRQRNAAREGQGAAADLVAARAKLAEVRRAGEAWSLAYASWEVGIANWRKCEAQREAQREALLQAMATAEDQLDAAVSVAQTADLTRSVADHVCDVLGMRGVRAHVLGQTLAGIEAVANVYLARIAPAGVSVRLTSYTETKSGTLQDRISLQVLGAGGGHGYRAASGGERRRIDVALMLALSEVSADAAGRSRGTLFFDEVFDAIDDEGVDPISATLAELARERAVVVVTHSERLAARLPATTRIDMRARQGGR